MKRVLLTGSSGFIGRCTPALLAPLGYEIHAVGRHGRPGTSPGLSYHVADLLDGRETEAVLSRVQPTHLLHFAWYTVPGRYWTAPDNLRWTEASLRLLRAFEAHGGRRVVMAGTCAEYDWRYGYCSERLTPVIPSSLYGTCKHALQQVVSAHCAEVGLSSAWGRIFFVYGPYEHPSRLVPSVIRALRQGVPARCTAGTQLRDFLHVRDVAAAFVALLDSTIEGPVNIGSGQPVEIRRLIYAIADTLGRRDLVELGALALPASDPLAVIADVARLHDDLGWSPEYDLDSGITDTITWWMGQAVQT